EPAGDGALAAIYLDVGREHELGAWVKVGGPGFADIDVSPAAIAAATEEPGQIHGVELERSNQGGVTAVTFTHRSFLVERTLRYDVEQQTVSVVREKPIPGMNDLAVHRIEVPGTADGGTSIDTFAWVIGPKTVKPDTPLPAFLAMYGCCGQSMSAGRLFRQNAAYGALARADGDWPGAWIIVPADVGQRARTAPAQREIVLAALRAADRQGLTRPGQVGFVRESGGATNAIIMVLDAAAGYVATLKQLGPTAPPPAFSPPLDHLVVRSPVATHQTRGARFYGAPEFGAQDLRQRAQALLDEIESLPDPQKDAVRRALGRVAIELSGGADDDAMRISATQHLAALLKAAGFRTTFVGADREGHFFPPAYLMDRVAHLKRTWAPRP
ncbi:MAG: hypothetical protein AAFU70_11710, partial [Planctomycetota bacterium]